MPINLHYMMDSFVLPTVEYLFASVSGENFFTNLICPKQYVII